MNSALGSSMGGTSGSNGGSSQSVSKVINYYQTNNSPKALSRKEIYRQTKNALGFAK